MSSENMTSGNTSMNDPALLVKYGGSRCQAKFLTSHHVRMHIAIFYISNTLRKLMIRAWLRI